MVELFIAFSVENQSNCLKLEKLRNRWIFDYFG